MENDPRFDSSSSVDAATELVSDLEKLNLESGKVSVIGIYSGMCPEKEMEYRARECLIHPLEATTETASLGQHFRICDRTKMVKCYSRPAAGKELSRPEILRPFGVLKRTTDYLLKLTMNSDRPWNIVYDFVVDRLRSVRQDMIIQELEPMETMTLLSPMLTYFFYSKYKCETQRCPTYNSCLHTSQMEECVDRFLVAFFEATQSQNTSQCQNYSVLRIILLYRLKSWSISARLFYLTFNKYDRHEIVFRLGQLYRQGNFVGFFRLFAKLALEDKLAVAAGISIAKFRLDSLWTIRKAYVRSKIPMEKIVQWLAFKNVQDALSCVTDCGFEVTETGLVDFTGGQQNRNPNVESSSHWCRFPDDEILQYNLV